MAEGKFIGYYRVSTQQQGRSGLGLAGQKAAVAEYLNGGQWSLCAEYTEVESGRKKDRPQLAQAINACKVYGATLVIAKIDRLSRNVGFLCSLRDAGLDFIAVDMPSANRLTVNILASVAEDEAERISARTKAALAAKVIRDGQWDRKASHHLVAGIGQAAASASRTRTAIAKAIELEPFIAEIEAMGITSLRGIADAMAAKGIPGNWSAMSVSRVKARLAA